MAMSRSFGGTWVTSRSPMWIVPVVDRLQPGEHPQRRRLAAPRRPDEHQELAVVDLQVEVVDGGVVEPAVGARRSGERDGGHRLGQYPHATSPCPQWTAASGPVRKDERAGPGPEAARRLAAVSERITTADVVHVAKLARLALTDDEIARTTAQLGDMLDHFADIDELDLDEVAPMTQPYPLRNVLRDDVVQPGLDRDEVLAAAPDAFEGRFRVPPIIGLAE